MGWWLMWEEEEDNEENNRRKRNRKKNKNIKTRVLWTFDLFKQLKNLFFKIFFKTASVPPKKPLHLRS